MKFAAFTVALVLLVVVFSSAVFALPSVQQERDVMEMAGDSEATRVAMELAARILRAQRMSLFSFGGGFPTGLQKRNSELINSLLGLPKVMNDAGKK